MPEVENIVISNEVNVATWRAIGRWHYLVVRRFAAALVVAWQRCMLLWTLHVHSQHKFSDFGELICQSRVFIVKIV